MVNGWRRSCPGLPLFILIQVLLQDFDQKMSGLTITTIQTRLHWENKTANLQMLEEKISSIKEKTEVVVLPEMFSTGFSMRPEQLAETMDGETVQWMKRIAAEKKIILTGSIIIKEEAHYYNRLIWMLPNGQHGVYDKRHRFAFAGEDNYYTAGTKRLIASVKGWKINLQVCYDLRFPVWARQCPLPTSPARGGEKLCNQGRIRCTDICSQLAREEKPCLENIIAGKGN